MILKCFHLKLNRKHLKNWLKNTRKNWTCAEDAEKHFDLTDSISETFKGILEQIEEKSEYFVNIGSVKKNIFEDFSELISILVSGEYNSIEEIKGIVKIAVERTLKLWPQQKQL